MATLLIEWCQKHLYLPWDLEGLNQVLSIVLESATKEVNPTASMILTKLPNILHTVRNKLYITAKSVRFYWQVKASVSWKLQITNRHTSPIQENNKSINFCRIFNLLCQIWEKNKWWWILPLKRLIQSINQNKARLKSITVIFMKLLMNINAECLKNLSRITITRSKSPIKEKISYKLPFLIQKEWKMT